MIAGNTGVYCGDLGKNRDVFSQDRLLVNSRTVLGLYNGHMTIFKINNMNKCIYRVLTHSNVKTVSLFSSSSIDLSGHGERVVTLRSAANGPGIRIVERHVLSVGPGIDIVTRQMFCAPRGTSNCSLSRCSCVTSYVSAVSSGVSLVMETANEGVPVVDTVNTNGGLSPAGVRITSVCGASMYPLTHALECRLHGEKIGRLGYMCSTRRPVGPSRIPGRCNERVPTSVTFYPSIVKVVVTERVILSLAGK